jgi:hypothetical protein
MSLSDAEYAALRQTIASRGTVRTVLVPLLILGWSVLVTAGPVAGAWGGLPSLLVLAAGFEAVHALHVGVERIGRYLQVFYEHEPGGPRWETTAMAVGPALPGGGIDPLFTAVFSGAVLLNLAPTAAGLARLASGMPGAAVVVTWLAVASVLAHAGVLVRIVRARRAAVRQRAVELESYRALRARGQQTS